MSQLTLFFVLGLSVGAVYAALALGIVLTYKGTGVINFAAAAMASVPLYVFDELGRGRFTLPLPWLPSFDVDAPPTWFSVLVALLVAALLAAIVEIGISRPLRNAPALAKVVAAVGILLTLQAAVGLKYGPEARSRTRLLPSGTVEIGGAMVTVDRLWFTGIVVALGAVAAVWFRRSRTGLAVQAASENERAAGFAGLSTERLGLVTWTLASMLMSFVVIVGGPITGVITPTNLTLLVVPALAAALVAQLRSLWLALFGGLGLGVLQSEMQYLAQSTDWWPEWGKQGLTDAVPFVVIVAALALLGKSIPMRGDDVRSGLPPVILPRNRPAVIGSIVVAGVVVLTLTSGGYRFGVITSLALALIALSLVVVTGMVGQISLAQAAFAGVAGLLVSKIGVSIPFPFSMVVAALGAAAAGVFVGLPALRIRGAQLAVVTLAAALTLEKFVFSNPQIVSSTADLIPAPSLLGRDVSVRSGTEIARLEFGLLVLAVVVVVFLLVSNVMRSGSGRKMLAVRSNERAAASVGIGVAGLKLMAFGLSSFIAGLGGALMGYSRGQVSAGSFGVFVGLSLLATAYLGGITSASGAVIAGAAGALGIAYVIFDRNLSLGDYFPLLSGIGLILTVILNPVGIAGKMRSDWDRIRTRPRAKDDTVPLGGHAIDEAEATVVDTTANANERPARVRSFGNVVLTVRDMSVSYGGICAVDDFSLDLREREIVGLIGPNGAGKTSFIDAVTGFTPSAGTVMLSGESVSGWPPYRRARAGLARTWQTVELFDDLSVENNVRVSDDVGSDLWRLMRDAFRPNHPASPNVEEALALMLLDDDAGRMPSELPLGRQKALGVARALAMSPTALLLDEPAAGLDARESREFGERLRAIAATGVGCLLIDHDMHLMLGVCDRIHVIDFGKQIAVGTPEEVRADPAVLAAYLGSDDVDADRAVLHARIS